MLTVKPPISLVSTKPLGKRYDSFEQRIMANYQLMDLNLEPEDFLHLVTAPPEIYLAEGGMTQLIEDVDVYQNRNMKLSMINNMINRITLAQSEAVTYQDQVFLSTMLRKLGIRDVQAFMHEIQSLKEETNSTRELTHIYEEHAHTLREITLQYKKDTPETPILEEESSEPEQGIENYLYETILNRLQTAAVYQEMKAYTSVYPGNDTYIRKEELQLSEQNRMLQQMELHQLQNVVHMEETPLVYQHMNTYEYPAAEEEMVPEGVTNRLVEAVLYDIVDRIYQVRLPQILNRREIWYQLGGSLYEIAGDTMKRFQENHSTDVRQSIQMNAYVEQVQNLQKQEIHGLKQLITYAEQNEQQVYNEELLMQNVQNHNIEQPISRQVQTRQENREYNTENLIWNQETEVTEEQTVVEDHSEELHRELRQINRQNIENQKRITQILNAAKPQPVRTPDHKRMMQEGLRAIDHPQEVLMEYHQMLTREEQEGDTITQEYQQLLSPETREIFRILEQYRKNPAQVLAQGLVREHADGQLMADLVYQESKNVVEQQEEQTILHQEQIEQIKQQLLNQWNQPQEYRKLYQELPQVRETIEMVHKQQDNQLEEEVLSELLEQNRTLRQHTVQKEQLLTTEQIEERTTQTVHRQVLETSTMDIERLIQEGMRSQVAELSDQVYTRLEKRLGNERMRRGR